MSKQNRYSTKNLDIIISHLPRLHHQTFSCQFIYSIFYPATCSGFVLVSYFYLLFDSFCIFIFFTWDNYSYFKNVLKCDFLKFSILFSSNIVIIETNSKSKYLCHFYEAWSYFSFCAYCFFAWNYPWNNSIYSTNYIFYVVSQTF